MLVQTVKRKRYINNMYTYVIKFMYIHIDILTLCLKLNNANPKYAKTQVSAMKANVLIVCCIVICVTVDKLKCV